MSPEDNLATDGVVRLRALRTSDLAVHDAGQDQEIIRWTNDGLVSSIERHRAWLESCARRWRHGSSVVDLGVERLDTGELAGLVGIQTALDHLRPGQANLTYSLYPRHRGRGLAAAAVRLAMPLARSLWAVDEFLIRCAPGNHASAAVARRLGFEYVGCIDEAEGPLDRYVLRSAAGSPPRGDCG